jgi:hypothetical protein
VIEPAEPKCSFQKAFRQFKTVRCFQYVILFWKFIDNLVTGNEPCYARAHAFCENDSRGKHYRDWRYTRD